MQVVSFGIRIPYNNFLKDLYRENKEAYKYPFLRNYRSSLFPRVGRNFDFLKNQYLFDPHKFNKQSEQIMRYIE